MSKGKHPEIQNMSSTCHPKHHLAWKWVFDGFSQFHANKLLGQPGETGCGGEPADEMRLFKKSINLKSHLVRAPRAATT